MTRLRDVSIVFQNCIRARARATSSVIFPVDEYIKLHLTAYLFIFRSYIAVISDATIIIRSQKYLPLTSTRRIRFAFLNLILNIGNYSRL